MTSTFDDGDVVERRSARLGALLAASDEAPRHIAFPAARVARAARRGVLVRRLAMAAAVALLLAGTLGVPQVRAWVVGSAKALWSHVKRTGTVPVRTAPATAPADSALLGAVTIPVSDAFAIRVMARQAEGTLLVELTSDSVATASVNGASNTAELVVLPGELRIVNDRASQAGYRIRVPERVSRLTVQVGGRPVQVLRPGTADRWTIDVGVPK